MYYRSLAEEVFPDEERKDHGEDVRTMAVREPFEETG
jgi:hypothetical protein